MAKKNVKTLQLTHASMRYDDSPAEFRADLRKLESYGGDIIGFTEVAGRNKILNDFARANDMRAITFPAGDGGFLVRTGENLKVRRKNAVKGHPGIKGQYGPRYVHEVSVLFHGRVLWAHEAHWVNKAENSRLRAEHHSKMTRVIASEVRRHAKGDRLSFFMGDLNFDPNEKGYPRELFRRNKLAVCWDDAGVQPPTGPGGGTIDIIGRYKPDKAVSYKRYKMHPKGNADHRPFSVFYEIELNTKTKDDNDDPGKTKNDDVYTTAGNVSWADYQDDSVYKLPYAVDDSDTENG